MFVIFQIFKETLWLIKTGLVLKNMKHENEASSILQNHKMIK